MLLAEASVVKMQLAEASAAQMLVPAESAVQMLLVAESADQIIMSEPKHDNFCVFASQPFSPEPNSHYRHCQLEISGYWEAIFVFGHLRPVHLIKNELTLTKKILP